jgi:sulfate adenylyltransferase
MEGGPAENGRFRQPYEVPEKPEMKLDTAELTPDLSAHLIHVKLDSMGFLK